MRLLLLLFALPLSAQTRIDDSDLAPRPPRVRVEAEASRVGRTLIFRAASMEPPRETARREILGRIALADRAGEGHPARLARARLVGPQASQEWVPIDDSGGFRFPIDAPGTYRVRFSLDNKFWAFHNPRAGSTYEWESAPVALSTGGADLGVLRPEPGSDNGKLGVLHLTYLEAKDFLEREGSVAWWKKPLTVNWPGEGSFFSPWAWSIDLTDALAWDVNLHELGHAVMAGAMRAQPAGGSHKIDECYSQALAWSEGWATFFAAAVRLSPDDPDAKFEYLVPRRAPVRLENVPDDVCAGQANEWRVAAGLWDLYDAHEDGRDRFRIGFARLWHALEGQTMGSLDSAWDLIAKEMNPLQKAAAREALVQNTLLPPAPSFAWSPARLPSPTMEW